jgi:hypothetical protein
MQAQLESGALSLSRSMEMICSVPPGVPTELLRAQVAAPPLCSDHGLAGQAVEQLTDSDGSQLAFGLPQGNQARRTEELSKGCLAMNDFVLRA